jgi:molecular chaperone GrpE
MYMVMEPKENQEPEIDEPSIEEPRGELLDEEIELSQEDSPEIEEEELDEVQQRMLQLEQESKENFDKYLRAVAELENFKKRNAKERADMLRYAGEFLARDLLNVIDDLERAISQEKLGSAEEILEGIRLIHGGFINVLKRHSVEPFESAGEKFDPNKHEALAIVPSEEHPPGVVMEQLKKAYLFKDKLLRPAQVVVSAEPASEPDSSDSEA